MHRKAQIKKENREGNSTWMIRMREEMNNGQWKNRVPS
jgi:hypothetical protein